MHTNESDAGQGVLALSLSAMPAYTLGGGEHEIPKQADSTLAHRIKALTGEYANNRQQRNQNGSDEPISARTPLDGQQIGNYTLLRQIGRGSYTTIYLGAHTYLGSKTALKLVNLFLTSNDDLASFQFEARLLAHLRHRHIVRALDFGWEQGTPYLVMEYAPQGTVEQRFPAGTPLPLDAILSTVTQVASALNYVHNHSLVHCDVNPANVLLGPHDEIWLGDFGIATTTTSNQSYNSRTLRGTAEYLAPEQISGHPLPATDQYALGVMVYQWLCGELPFQGTPLRICHQHLSTPPPSLRDHVPSISPAVERVVMKALAKDPSRRFAHVLGFARALKRAHQG